jgi:hypothetical protein
MKFNLERLINVNIIGNPLLYVDLKAGCGCAFGMAYIASDAWKGFAVPERDGYNSIWQVGMKYNYPSLYTDLREIEHQMILRARDNYRVTNQLPDKQDFNLSADKRENYLTDDDKAEFKKQVIDVLAAHMKATEVQEKTAELIGVTQ